MPTTKTKKTAKSTKSAKAAKSTNGAKGKAAKSTKAAAKGAKSDLRKAQVRIIQTLAKSKALTRAELSAKAVVDSASLTEYVGSLYDDVRVANDRKHFTSLLSRKLVKAEQHDVDGRDVVYFSVTSAGKKMANNLPKSK
jgi:DNA-binding MarR family transcriptional regulator